jgi:hypothetical protein
LGQFVANCACKAAYFVANCACKAAFWVNLWQIVPVKQHFGSICGILCKGTNEPDGEKQAMAHKMGFKTSSP